MSKGMHNAQQVLHILNRRHFFSSLLCTSDPLITASVQVLLSGCSAGGLAVILHCDNFRGLFPSNTKVKCLSDAGMFLDA